VSAKQDEDRKRVCQPYPGKHTLCDGVAAGGGCREPHPNKLLCNALHVHLAPHRSLISMLMMQEIASVL